MSSCTHESMTNHHVQNGLSLAGILTQLGGVLHTWRARHEQRGELAQWNERDIRDAGFSRGEVLFEAGKPFWRA
ncbi:MAG: hypothetical protein JWQ94_2913 [Tardiphaga sp.]|nr:hypothetical protein [Tardiphaga sp.]